MTKFENDRREVAEDYHEAPNQPTGVLAWVLLMAVIALATSGTLIWSLVVVSLGGFR